MTILKRLSIDAFFQGLLKISDDFAKDFEKDVDQFFITIVFVSSSNYNFPVRHPSLSSTLTEIFSCFVYTTHPVYASDQSE